MKIPVSVERVTLDTSSNRFVVILRDEDYSRWLPIVVGPAEAHAIALELEAVKLPRPMTHDLLKNILDNMDAQLKEVCVSDLKDNTYYAILQVTFNNHTLHIDSRPSDAIALALRTESPIYVEEDVMKRAAISETMPEETVAETSTQAEELNTLKTKLQEAVKEERYEDAARYRDAINEIMEKLGEPDEDTSAGQD